MEKQKLNIPKITIAFFFFMMLLGCASKQSLSTNTNKIEKTPKIIFLNYTIKKTSNGNRTVSLINKIITEGKLKDHNKNSKKEPVSGDLMCYQLDKKSNILQSIIVKNPLKKTVESLNDSKSFQTSHIELKHTSFSLRLKLEPQTKYISINEITQVKKEIKPLIKTKIN
ncbi:hypothetical protein [Flavivirga rizhaonensis]|uniref:Lipoprotein n=1 Tax=Flavivirga rizhaonensis TaxID=2559571 RepID=A0A4S1DWX5_9FLAO|nr:hypothetical protein [Flavivirga rizhaonensis]TGV02028.1 hypothetical protein EM932_12655 [Flavivirga rizhaonensis]